jgi:four helix bundle protein
LSYVQTGIEAVTPDQLQDRLLTVAEATSRALARPPKGGLGRHVHPQLLRSAIAPAAIYAEARGAESRRDVVHRMQLGLKQLRETLVWLELLRRLDNPPAVSPWRPHATSSSPYSSRASRPPAAASLP